MVSKNVSFAGCPNLLAVEVDLDLMVEVSHVNASSSWYVTDRKEAMLLGKCNTNIN